MPALMEIFMDEEIRKVNPAQVEVIGTHGEVVQEAKESKRAERFQETPFGRVKVMQASPWMLLLIPIVLPLFIFALFFISVLALFFGKSVFKIAGKGIRRP
jgi:hypothetical protein